MGLIDLKAWNEIDRRGPAIRTVDSEQKALNEWRQYCDLARLVACSSKRWTMDRVLAAANALIS